MRLPAAAAQVELPPTRHDPEAVGELADEVLARPEFGRSENVLRQLQDWVVEQITDALSALGSADGASLVGWVVMALVVVGAIVLIARFGRGIRRDPGAGPGVVGPGRRTGREWREEAARLMAAGDHRGAMRAHHRALLAELGLRALVEEVPGRTAREYRADIVAAVPAATAPADEATVLFEQGVYGPGRPGADDVDRFALLAHEIVTGAGG